MTEDSFHLLGGAPARVELPRTVSEAQSVVAEAGPDAAFFPCGGGTRLGTGYAPGRAGVVLSTRNLNQITEYQPADMTVTAQAGVTLSQLQETLAPHGQWLPLAPALPAVQTLGGIVAARAHSLFRAAHGSVRDSVIGAKIINDRGEIIQGGGKVVKNVSGYDLPKLFCGSWGTLGLITEATFKVAPLPERCATVALPLDADLNSEDTLDTLLGSPLAPSFVFLLSPGAARDVLQTETDAQYLILGFDGLEDDVDWQLTTLGASDNLIAGDIADCIRARLRDFSLRDAPLTCTFHILSSQVGAYSRMMEWTARRAGFEASVASDAATGIVCAHFYPARDDADWLLFYADLANKAARVGGSATIDRMPDALRTAGAPVWSPLLADFGLMTRMKEAFDPRRRWNPGRFIGRL